MTRQQATPPTTQHTTDGKGQRTGTAYSDRQRPFGQWLRQINGH